MANSPEGYCQVAVCVKCGDGQPSLVVYVDTNVENNGKYHFEPED